MKSVSPRAPVVHVETTCRLQPSPLPAPPLTTPCGRVASRGDQTKVYSLIRWATKMHGSNSCASMACMHGCIQVTKQYEIHTHHDELPLYVFCLLVHDGRKLARQETRRSWATTAAAGGIFLFRSEIGMCRPRRRFTEIKDVVVLLSQATTTLSDIAVYPSAPTSSCRGHHSVFFLISFSFFFFFWSSCLLASRLHGCTPRTLVPGTAIPATNRNHTLLGDLCCIDIGDDWLLRLWQFHLDYIDYGTKGYHPYWAHLPVSSPVQVFTLLTLGLRGMLEYMVVRVILRYDWFVWTPSIYIIIPYLLSIYSYIYRPTETQYNQSTLHNILLSLYYPTKILFGS